MFRRDIVMCGKTHVLLYIREFVLKDLSEKEIEDKEKKFEEFIKKYDINLDKPKNMFIYSKF
jgi:hypothetical protein